MFDSMTGFISAHQVAFAFAALPILSYLTLVNFVGGMMVMLVGVTTKRLGITCFGISLVVFSVLPGAFFFVLFGVLTNLDDSPMRLFAAPISLVTAIFGSWTATLYENPKN